MRTPAPPDDVAPRTVRAAPRCRSGASTIVLPCMHSRRQREQPQSAFGALPWRCGSCRRRRPPPGLRKVRVSPRTEARRRDRFEPQRQIGDALARPSSTCASTSRRPPSARTGRRAVRRRGHRRTRPPAILASPESTAPTGEIGLCSARRHAAWLCTSWSLLGRRSTHRRVRGERREFGSRVGDPARTDQGRDQESPHLQALVVQVHLPEDLGRAPVVPDRVAVARGLRVQAAQVLAHHRQPQLSLRSSARRSPVGFGLRPERGPRCSPGGLPAPQR